MMADMVIVFMNSARKNRAKRIELYSVWKPPTSSCSASTRSNGGRFSSAVRGDQEDDEGHEPGGPQVPVGYDVASLADWPTMSWVRERARLTSTTAATDRPSAAS